MEEVKVPDRALLVLPLESDAVIEGKQVSLVPLPAVDLAPTWRYTKQKVTPQVTNVIYETGFTFI